MRLCGISNYYTVQGLLTRTRYVQRGKQAK